MYIPDDDDIKLDDIDTEVEEEEEEEDADGWEEAGESDGDAEAGAEGDADPQSLADAFSRIHQMDSGDAEDTVGDGSEVDDGDLGDGDGEAEEHDEADEAAEDGGHDADRGPSDGVDTARYQASQQAIIQQLNQQAVREAREMFRKEGIREFTMDDVYQRTQDGRVVYRNPDDPNRPFSSRMEAQQWIDSFNKQVQDALVKQATEIRDKNAKAAMPALRLLQFAPVYDVMDPSIREVFDDLIEDYEIRNRAGKVIGYSCDLEKMAMKASRLATKYNHHSQSKGKSGTVKKPGPQKSPAMDTKARGSAASASVEGEPKTMEEAMKRLREMNRSKK